MLRRLLPAALAAVLGLGLVACDNDTHTSPARYTATMDFMGMGPHLGQNLYLRVRHAGTGLEVARTWVNPVVVSNFTVPVPDILILGETYYVEFWADVDMDGAYDWPVGDHSWRRTIGPVAGPVTLSFTHDTNWDYLGDPPWF